MEQQTADREATLEEKIAKVNSYLSSLSPSIGDFDEKMIPSDLFYMQSSFSLDGYTLHYHDRNSMTHPYLDCFLHRPI